MPIVKHCRRNLGPSSSSSDTIVVVGGGPAGLASAIYAARAGLSVTLLEQRALPADKACGEGLMPSGVGLLEEMGVDLGRIRSRPFEGIRYIDGDCSVQGRFANGTGLGIRRCDLSRALLARARALGVDLRDGVRVGSVRLEDRRHSPNHDDDRVVVTTSVGEVRARWLVAADGLRSPLRRAFGLEGVSRSRVPERFGSRRHFRCRPWSSFVEVHWSETAEAYVTPVSEDEVGVAVLWHGVRPSRGDWLASFPRLGRELRGAEIISTLRGAGPLRQSARRVTRGPAALVGDAAGYVDALTGEGIALGFRTARAAVAAIASGELHPYERAYAKASRRYRAVTELALSLASSPRARRHSIRALARRPALFERMLGWMS